MPSTYRLLQFALALFGAMAMGHLAGDVPALLLIAVVLSALMLASGLTQSAPEPTAATR